MTPTIQQEIELLENTKEDLALAIMEKGVVVQPSDLFSTYPTSISHITTTAGDKDELFKSIIDRSITSLTVPSGTTVLRPKLFTGCVNLTTLTLPEGLKTIKDGALSGAIAVTNLSIPDSVTTIEDCSSFHQTSSLTELTIGTGITYIGNMAFYGNPNLTSITITATTPPTLGSNNNAFNSTNNCPIYVPASSVDAYKTAWPTYASRIQAILMFRKITDLQDVTSGTYLLVNENDGIVLNASLIKNTTSTANGINSGTTNTESVTITNGTITPNSVTDNCSFEYDAVKGKLKKKINNTYYYLRPGISSSIAQEYFNYLNKTTEYGEEIDVEPVKPNTALFFKSYDYQVGLGYSTTKADRIRWYPSYTRPYFTPMALYKLDE